MFAYTSLTPHDIIQMKGRVILNIVSLVITISITQGIYIHPEDQTPATSTASPGRATISSVLDQPPETDASKRRKMSNATIPILDYVDEEESTIYYEYETVNQTHVQDSSTLENEDAYCTFTLYVSPNLGKEERGCRVQSTGERKTQGGKAAVVTSGPRIDVGLKRRLGRAERRIDLLERQLFRQSEVLAKLQNQMFGMIKSEEAGLCESSLGWVRHGDSCYWFGAHHVSWEAARVICKAKAKNADLAVPSDENEIRVLASYAQYYDPEYSWWLGCSQYQVGDWRCVDGKSLNFTNWRMDHPSNYENQRCLQLGRPSKVDFVDTQCNQKWPFACEKPMKLKQSS